MRMGPATSGVKKKVDRRGLPDYLRGMADRRKVATTLPSDVHDRLKSVAERLGFKMQALVERWIVAGLDKLEREEQRRGIR